MRAWPTHDGAAAAANTLESHFMRPGVNHVQEYFDPWFGSMVKKKTPAAIVGILNRAFNEALGRSDQRARHTGRRTEMTEL